MILQELDVKYNNKKWLNPSDQIGKPLEDEALTRKPAFYSSRGNRSVGKFVQIKPLQKIVIPRNIISKAQNFFIVNGGKIEQKPKRWYQFRDTNAHSARRIAKELRDDLF
eukprot:CAMPEP_0168319310 /NCGR_PEP_ID=MMETSP0213-20121227/977_1 /TAXON_ID=151035 /ORGANISM="Euplotes harpa, Strain FSP1.4" /LENGTH=109 /DNA_ID=CAMNT_0008320501 /DNA_START=3 /DNA_END=332 /DNA_ORIENTATION=+